MIEYVWGRKDIAKKQRIKFLIDVMENDESLRAVEYAGRYFAEAASLNLKSLALPYYFKWWTENRNAIS